MGHYHADQPKRAIINVINTTASATPDVVFYPPYDWDEFWDNLQADADDIRITEADGETLCAYEITAGTKAARNLEISIDAATAAAVDGVYVLWIYWGDAAAANAETVTAIASAKVGVVELGFPVRPRVFESIRPGGTIPAELYLKGTAEQIDIWWEITGQLRRRRSAYNSRDTWEEPFSVIVGVNLAGVSQASMFDDALQRFVFHAGRYFVRQRVKAGTDGVSYTANARLTTYIPYIDGATMGQGRVIEARAKVYVTDATES